MTIGKLHRKLAELIQQGHARKLVVINKKTFTHPLESDGCCMLDIADLGLEIYNIMNDDGGIIHDNGNEKLTQSLVLRGE
jgi:hypothetical protein